MSSLLLTTLDTGNTFHVLLHDDDTENHVFAVSNHA